jgi:hypothetical protein
MDQFNAWLENGELGLSSKVLGSLLTGNTGPAINQPESHPKDPFSFRRCMLLFEWVPDLRYELHQMRFVSPEWEAIVDHWDELEALLNEEMPFWREAKGAGRAPKCQQRLNEILS